ncbi:hypothetical protein [Novosphingobium aquimarinum]|uniref:hypothetical protein n=1 Tax=Novosphingobium aquimarinum TaxID=2682494 RepID=UPI0012EC1EF1|nr:hypothetical protein [Novosphingobium aquimarinum]
MVRKGIFRTELPGIGQCARVDMRAGDAAPYLEKSMYELLGFQPPFETLPTREVRSLMAA